MNWIDICQIDNLWAHDCFIGIEIRNQNKFIDTILKN
jgi:hypothetical protein